MSFFSPKFTQNEEQFTHAITNLKNDEFVTGPFNLSLSTIEKEKEKENSRWSHIHTLMIFNLPQEITVSINQMAIPSTVFDYYNPLLINPSILPHIQFINHNTYEKVNNINCYVIISLNINKLTDNILNNIIYYPPRYSINYVKLNVNRSDGGTQIFDIITNPSSTLVNLTNTPIPINSRFSNNTQLYTPIGNRLSSLFNNESVMPPNLITLLLSSMQINNHNFDEYEDENEDEDVPGLIDPSFDDLGDQPVDGQNF